MNLINASVSGKVSVSFSMEDSSASSSDSEVGSRCNSRRASMDVALRLVDFAQSAVQEGSDPQGSHSRGDDLGAARKRQGLKRQDAEAEKDQASALNIFDSPSAGSEDSHRKGGTSRPPRLRPHVCIKHL